MRVFSQNKDCPSQVLFAFDEVVNPSVNQLKWAVAYSTYRGCVRLVNRLMGLMGESQWAECNKSFITSLDFGLTDPAALEFLGGLSNSSVYIANPEVIERNGFMPAKAYHPKLYLFDSPTDSGFVIGSANLTESALITNTEVVVAGTEIPDVGNWADVWASSLVGAVPLSNDLLERYRARRIEARKRLVDADPDIPGPVTQPIENPVFWDALTNRGFIPATFNHFWIEAGSMSSGGSHNQLELPRGANRFFGFTHLDYRDDHVTIGQPILTVREKTWTDRPLTWHGNNKMERINLPTLHQGGYDYQHKAVLFRRHERGYEIKVTPWNDANSLAWRNASESLNAVFRLGTRGQRICGFF